MSRNAEAREAREAGLTRFISSYPCRKCGGTEFKVADASCWTCRKAKQNAVRATEEGRQYARDACNKFRKENLEEERARGRAYFKTERGRALNRERRTRRRAIVKQQTPGWADLEAIRMFYLNCPAGYEVDHIIPLKGKLVSGLHTLSNLQYLPADVNRSKGNKYEL